VRSAPDDLTDDALAAALARHWVIAVASIEYRPVGFGSHHWEVVDADGVRWFVTVDELDTKRASLDEPLDAAFDRLRAALLAARDLRANGRDFVVAAVPAVNGEPVVRLGERHAVAVFPFVDGESFDWGTFADGHREALLDLIVATHTAPESAWRAALADDFRIPHRDELELSLASPDNFPDCGPYSRPTAELLAERGDAIRALLARCDALVGDARGRPARVVLTHGEPHPGNTMRTAGGWLLIDWDTVLVAPPERDLWSMDPGDGSILDAYARATGVTPSPSTMDLYRLRWDLADVAVVVSRFRAPHPGNADDQESFEIFGALDQVAGS
jgi:spectinomycin phosphotransferase/16S rRNA (guanine(1405)-N(7))-methyltransferase